MSALQSTTPGSPLSPALFFQTVQSQQHAFILKAGVDLDMFTVIAKGSHTVKEIASACAVPERGIRVLCDCLTVLGFLIKNGNRYSLTRTAPRFWIAARPRFWAGRLSSCSTRARLNPSST